MQNQKRLILCFTAVVSGCATQALDADIGSSGAALAEVQSDDDQVHTGSGDLHGKVVGNTREFLGIPYAKPPARFAPSEPVEPWTDVRDALEFGPVCPQQEGALSAPGDQSENCLTLNVFTPSDAKKHGLPVMVFIHGGAFISGGSNQYDAQKLSEAGHVVVVTLNYRLGALGFLSHPALDQSRPLGAPSGNDGFRDQQLALRWVKDNVAAFGGDDAHVTIFGESAGSMSVCLQMVSPLSRDLGQQFIMESGTCVGGLPIVDKEAANTLGTALGDELCKGETDVLACLRAKPVADLLAWRADGGISGAGWGPVANPADPFLPAKPADLIAAGNYNHGPIIVGINKNEWGLFQLVGLSPSIKTISDLQMAVSKQFGPVADTVLGQYPVTDDAAANAVFINMMTDVVFRCPTRSLARQAVAHGSSVHVYSFEEGLAYHAMEVPYVFNNPDPKLAPMLVESLRSTIQSAWTSFATNGDPNSDAPLWPRYDLVGERYLTLQAKSQANTGLGDAHCDFWDLIATLM